MVRNYIDIDFEFYDTAESKLALVCCSLKCTDTGEVREYWLHGDHEEQLRLRGDIDYYSHEAYVIRAFAVVAEARSFLSLGILDEMLTEDIKWVDLHLEWRMLTNHNHSLQYGKQLIDGKVKFTIPPKPKWSRTEDDEANHAKCQHNLAAATYKLLGIQIDTAHKTEMRDIIISGDFENIEANREAIQEYCTSDIKYMDLIYKAMIVEYKKLFSKKDIKSLFKEMLYRGEYAARTAIIERDGYPIDYQKTKNFSQAVSGILRNLQQDINKQFVGELDVFRFNKKDSSYSWNQKICKNYFIKTLPQDMLDGWKKTDSKDMSLAQAAFEKYYQYRHTYPEGILGAQLLRYVKTRQSLNGFLPKKPDSKTKSFWESVGKDNHARPYLGIYGSQSARNQPSASGFIFLKSAWMRALVAPVPGEMLCGIDFGSEEFLIGGLLAKDRAMIEAYHTGDPYLYFGKAAKAIPQEGTKKSHPFLREKFKSTTLGIQYLMGAKALALKLTADTGVLHTQEEAEELIDLFDQVFWKYSDYRDSLLDSYDINGYLKLSDGWTMFGDNDNFRSTANFPVQGAGSVVLRKMVQYLQRKRMKIALTLHDASYCSHKLNDWDAVDAQFDCMYQSFYDVFEGHPMQEEARIRLDGDVWSPELFDGKFTTPMGREVTVKTTYVDPRAKTEYAQFKKYFDNDLDDLIRAV